MRAKPLILITTMIFSVAAQAADISKKCVCTNVNMPDAKFYSKLLNDSDVVFIGRIVDKLHVSPYDYIAVFEEGKMLKGAGRIPSFTDKSQSKGRFIRYVMVSDLDHDCSYRFDKFYETYIVFAKNKTKNLLVSDKCSGTTPYRDHVALLIASILHSR